MYIRFKLLFLSLILISIITSCDTQTGNSNSTNSTKQSVPADSNAITFISNGDSFNPIITVEGTPEILWTWADGSTSIETAPEKDYGTASQRANTLTVIPWSALRRINIGYTAEDGGSNTIERNTNQNVSEVRDLQLVAPYLVEWCSSYNPIESLDFSNFTNITTIECYSMDQITSITLSNMSSLRRLCVEDCALTTLDLSGCPALEDLRGALNDFPSMNFGTIGQHTWHICVRDNPQLTNTNNFGDMTQFPMLTELFIWNNNQDGTFALHSTNTNSYVSLQASGNHYSSLDLSGSLTLINNTGRVNFNGNRLTDVNISGCVQITNLQLQNNLLDTVDVDQILEVLDGLGRSDLNATEPLCDLRGNEACSATGRTHAQNLANKGWTVYTLNEEFTPPPPVNTGPAQIDFVTGGDTTSMYCTYQGTATLTWYWSDGTTQVATSGQTVIKTDLGSGTHSHYMTIDNGAALTRFGASSGGGLGHLVSITGLEACGYLNIIYVYNETGLASIGRTNTTRIREYHLAGTALSAITMDQIYADAVETEVTGGTIWAPNNGTTSSTANLQTLSDRGWTLH